MKSFDQWFAAQGQQEKICKGTNCNCTDGVNHSEECKAGHDQALKWEEYDAEEPEQAQCPGCGKWGEVNYFFENFPEYYCGGSPRCCP